MKRVLALPLVVIGLVILVLFGLQANGASGQQPTASLTPGPPGEKPTVVPAQNLTPVPKPPDKRQIAILTLEVSSNSAGQVVSIHLRKGRIINSYAPNVLHLSGEWTVELVTKAQQTIRFGTSDPRRTEVADPETKSFTTIIQPHVIWDLVVPLYDDANNLNVAKITIYDQSGKAIFSTPVDYQGWSQ